MVIYSNKGSNSDGDGDGDSNSNWTEWSTFIQGVIWQVISKLAKHTAQG